MANRDSVYVKRGKQPCVERAIIRRDQIPAWEARGFSVYDPDEESKALEDERVAVSSDAPVTDAGTMDDAAASGDF